MVFGSCSAEFAPGVVTRERHADKGPSDAEPAVVAIGSLQTSRRPVVALQFRGRVPPATFVKFRTVDALQFEDAGRVAGSVPQ